VGELARFGEESKREEDVREPRRSPVVDQAGRFVAPSRARASPSVRLLALQSAAGNAAVARLVAVRRSAGGGGPTGENDNQVEAGLLMFVRSSTPARSLRPARGQSATRAVSHVRHAGSKSVQRYQAGSRGHGGIEEEGLAQAGFSGDMGKGDIGKIYFGNWMRDWSQVPPGPAKSAIHGAVVAILNVLSMGEFDRPVSADDLGGYLPSEHMDNPLGGKTPESDNKTPEEVEAAVEAEKSLSPEQREALKRERSPEYQEKIRKATAASGLPEYIERGKQHSKDKLEQAVREEGGRDRAMMNLGNALHGIEDYYSHSNFSEVALAMLAKEGNRAAGLVLDTARRDMDGFDAATAGGIDPTTGRPKIITGTYGDESHSANKIVSLVEQLKSEVLTGALRMSFIKGMARMQGKVLGKETRIVAEVVAGPAAAVVGAGVGFGSGLVKGFEEGHGFLGTLGSMASEAVHGAESGPEAGVDAVGDAGESSGTALGDVIGGAEAIVLLGMATPLFVALDAAVALQLDELLSKERSKASAIGAPGGAPTHSQLAKDAPEHAVFATSRALAVNADKVIGGAVRAAWAMPDKDAAVQTVLPLVDKVVAQPADTREVWDKPLKDALAAHEPR
jgi:hypothetical protein